MRLFHLRIRRPLVLIVIAVALIAFAAVGASRYRALVQDEPGVRLDASNLFIDTFKEPFEVCLFMFSTGSWFTVTTQAVDRIEVPTSQILAMVDALGGVRQLLLVVHSHPGPAGFSPADNAFYSMLKDHGFRGVYGVYFTLGRKLTIKTDLGWGVN